MVKLLIYNVQNMLKMHIYPKYSFIILLVHIFKNTEKFLNIYIL